MMPPRPQHPQSTVDAQFRKALAFHQQNQLEAAERLYRDILKAHPRHASTLHMLALVCRRKNERQEALQLLTLAISLNKADPAAYSNLGNLLTDLGRGNEALEAFNKALELKPSFATALQNRSGCLASLGRLEEALRDLQQSLALAPGSADAYITMGNLLNRTKRYPEAVAAYETALGLHPNNPNIMSNIAATLMDMLQYERAEPLLNAALQLKPDLSSALNNRANLYTATKRPERALIDIQEALRIEPNFADGYLNLGNILQDLGQYREAIEAYAKSLKLNPQSATALSNTGNAFKELFQFEAALQCYDRAIRLQPDYAEAHYHRAIVLGDLKRSEEAVAAYARAVEYKEDHPMLFGQWIASRMMICDWQHLSKDVERLADKIRSGKNASTTFSILSTGLGPELIKQCATAFVRDKCWDRSRHYVYPPAHQNARIRVGYFSADFRNHAVAQLAVGVFENHDREKFDIVGINLSPLPADEMTQRVDKAFGGLVPVASLSIQQIVARVRNMNLDIAIDLNGHTKGSKLDLFAHRVAPVQVNYLGYPGTTGAPYMDYILADEVVIPPDAFVHYTEQVAHLPGSYLPNDSQKVIAGVTPSRAEAGLPQNGFVFCCFNASYKLNAEVFDIWLRLLERVSGSVFWLSEMDPAAMRNLRDLAQAKGVDPDRLVFAARTKGLAEHLARHRLADLFLDTTRYNAHTTASDALWAGLPVLTCIGDSFQGRVGASLLRALGLPELVTTSLADYEALAYRLATNPEPLRLLKEKLARHRTTHALFDTRRFTRELESVLSRMWQRYCQGLPPAHLRTVDGAGDVPESARPPSLPTH